MTGSEALSLSLMAGLTVFLAVAGLVAGLERARLAWELRVGRAGGAGTSVPRRGRSPENGPGARPAVKARGGLVPHRARRLLPAVAGAASGAAALLAGMPLTAAAGLGLGTALLAGTLGRDRARRRQDLADEVLEQHLGRFANALRSGATPVQALETLSREAAGPWADAWQQVLVAGRAGVPLERAVGSLAGRFGRRAVAELAQALAVHRLAGGDVVPVLDVLRASLRDRRALRGEIRARSAEARTSALVLTAIPLVLAAYYAALQPDLLRVLLDSPVGAAALGLSTLAWAAGTWLLGRLTDAEEAG